MPTSTPDDFQIEDNFYARNNVFPRIVSALEWFPPLNSFHTFMYCNKRSQYIGLNSKKNSFCGNYLRKYGTLTRYIPVDNIVLVKALLCKNALNDVTPALFLVSFWQLAAEKKTPKTLQL